MKKDEKHNLNFIKFYEYKHLHMQQVHEWTQKKEIKFKICTRINEINTK